VRVLAKGIFFAPINFTNESLTGPWMTGCASVLSH
jgi:hypothetical protein